MMTDLAMWTVRSGANWNVYYELLPKRLQLGATVGRLGRARAGNGHFPGFKGAEQFGKICSRFCSTKFLFNINIFYVS